MVYRCGLQAGARGGLHLPNRRLQALVSTYGALDGCDLYCSSLCIDAHHVIHKTSYALALTKSRGSRFVSTEQQVLF